MGRDPRPHFSPLLPLVPGRSHPNCGAPGREGGSRGQGRGRGRGRWRRRPRKVRPGAAGVHEETVPGEGGAGWGRSGGPRVTLSACVTVRLCNDAVCETLKCHFVQLLVNVTVCQCACHCASVGLCVYLSVFSFGGETGLRVCERACDHIRECVSGTSLRGLRLCLPM